MRLVRAILIFSILARSEECKCHRRLQFLARRLPDGPLISQSFRVCGDGRLNETEPRPGSWKGGRGKDLDPGEPLSSLPRSTA